MSKNEWLFIVFAFILSALSWAWLTHADEGEADVAEAFFNDLQAHRGLCTPQFYDPDYDPAIYWDGCTQRLTRCDQLLGGQNWTSRDWPMAGGGAYEDLSQTCDVATKYAGRTFYTVVIGGEPNPVIKQIIRPPVSASCIPAIDPEAVPGSGYQAQSYCVGYWMCDQTHPNGVIIHSYDGPYARAFNWQGWAPSGDLMQFGWLDFTHDPAYWEAYNAVADGFALVRGWAENRHSSWTIEAQREAWDKRHGIAGIMARGTIVAPHAIIPCWLAAEQTAEYVISRYMTDDLAWLQSNGWPTEDYGDPALTAAIDNWMERTGFGDDPRRIFADEDVVMEPATWGSIKALYRAPR